MKQRGFVPILVLVVVVLLAAGGLYYYKTHQKTFQEKLNEQNPNVNFMTPGPSGNKPAPDTTPQNDDTSNWKTYTSTKYQFKVNYPDNLTADDKSGADANKIGKNVTFNVKTEGPSFPVFYVSVYDGGQTDYNNETQDVLDKFFSAKVGENIKTRGDVFYQEGDFWTFKKLPDTRVDNKLATTVENSNVWEGSDKLKDRRLFVKNGDYIFEIGAYYSNSKEFNNFQTFVSSFKFTQKN